MAPGSLHDSGLTIDNKKKLSPQKSPYIEYAGKERERGESMCVHAIPSA